MPWYRRNCVFVCCPVKGPRRVNVLMKRGGQLLIDHMKRVMDQSGLNEPMPGEYARDLDERGKYWNIPLVPQWQEWLDSSCILIHKSGDLWKKILKTQN